jgi:hypothetical protein
MQVQADAVQTETGTEQQFGIPPAAFDPLVTKKIGGPLQNFENRPGLRQAQASWAAIASL